MDIFDKCYGNGGYFAEYRKKHDHFYAEPILDGIPGPRMLFNGKEVIVWSLNNYLGMAQHPAIKKALATHFEKNCCLGPMGSKLMTGCTTRHLELEEALAKFTNKQASVLFNSGYLAMMGTINALVGKDDIIIADKQSHACIVDGSLLASRGGHNFRIFRHNDPKSLERQLKSANENRKGGILIITEGVFSMTGETAPLQDIVALKNQYNARLLVDDAHGFGVLGETGRGTGELLGVQDDIDLYAATFTKAFSSMGGMIAGNTDVIEYIKFNARTNIFSASLKNIFIEAIFAALNVIQTDPSSRARMSEITQSLHDGLVDLGFDVGENTRTPILPIYLQDEKIMNTYLEKLRNEYSVFVSSVVPPVTPRGVFLLRMIATAAHSQVDVDQTLKGFSMIKHSMRKKTTSYSDYSEHQFYPKFMSAYSSV